jgi:hypothetical protein
MRAHRRFVTGRKGFLDYSKRNLNSIPMAAYTGAALEGKPVKILWAHGNSTLFPVCVCGVFPPYYFMGGFPPYCFMGGDFLHVVSWGISSFLMYLVMHCPIQSSVGPNSLLACYRARSGLKCQILVVRKFLHRCLYKNDDHAYVDKNVLQRCARISHILNHVC